MRRARVVFKERECAGRRSIRYKNKRVWEWGEEVDRIKELEKSPQTLQRPKYGMDDPPIFDHEKGLHHDRKLRGS